MSLWLPIVVAYGLALLGLSVYGLNLATLALIFAFRRRGQRPAPVLRLPTDPIVTIQLPLYNELYVAERVIRSACEIDYPTHLLEIQVLDDSTDETLELTRALAVEYQARGISIVHLHRSDRQGFKAGALAYGLARARGEFVAVFDADFVVPKDFLRRTLPHFGDPAVGIVQTRWAYFNEACSELTRAMALALDGHFVVEQSARCWAGWFLNFNGTAGVLRTRAITDAGGWQDDTITEDLDLSYRAQLAGWRAVYLRDVACASEIPTDIHGIKTQQFRWTKGAQETARKILPALWRSKARLGVKCEGTIHLLGSLAFPLVALVTLLSPFALIAAARHGLHVIQPIAWVNWLSLAGSFCCYYAAVRDLKSAWRSRICRFPLFLALSVGMSAHNTRAALEGILGKKTPFERTPKYRIVGQVTNHAPSHYRSRTRYGVAGECVLGAFAMASVACAIHFGQYAAVPFQLVFVAGYGMIAMYSVRQTPQARGEAHSAEVPGSVPARSVPRAPQTSAAATASVA